MSLIGYSIFLVVGFFLGVGATLLYIQYSMYSQFGEMEKQMEAMADIQENIGLEPEQSGQKEKEE